MELSENGYVLTPWRYVGVKAGDDDGEPFVERIQRLKAKLGKQLGGRRGFGHGITKFCLHKSP